MGVGDLKTGVISVAASATVNIQPAAGKTWIMKLLYDSGPAKFEIYLYDGTTAKLLRGAANGPPQMTNVICGNVDFRQGTAADIGIPKELYINNSLYLQLKNASAASYILIYAALQIK